MLGLTKTHASLRTERRRLLPDALRRRKHAELRRQRESKPLVAPPVPKEQRRAATACRKWREAQTRSHRAQLVRDVKAAAKSAQHTRTPLHPAALASVPYGIVLVRVRAKSGQGGVGGDDGGGASDTTGSGRGTAGGDGDGSSDGTSAGRSATCVGGKCDGTRGGRSAPGRWRR